MNKELLGFVSDPGILFFIVNYCISSSPPKNNTFPQVPRLVVDHEDILEYMPVKICFLNPSISRYLCNALQIQPQKLVQITLNSYAAELQKEIKKFFLGYVRFN